MRFKDTYGVWICSGGHIKWNNTWEINLTRLVNICTNIFNVRSRCGKNSRSTKGYFIPRLHSDISGHMNNINMNWNYFTNTLRGDKIVANFDTGNWSYIITRWGIFSIFNPIQDGPFRGCSWMGDKKDPSLKSVTHILQWWNLAQLYLT